MKNLRVIKIFCTGIILFFPFFASAANSIQSPPVVNNIPANTVINQEVKKQTNPTLDVLDRLNLNLSNDNPKVIAARLINSALQFLGVIFLVMIIYSGFAFMTSGGNDDKLKKARKGLFSAIIGAAIILMAYSIVNFVTNAVISASK